MKINLIKKFGSIKQFYKCSLDDLVYFNVCDRYINKILDKNIRNKLEVEKEFLLKNNIKTISFEEDKYPKKLKRIANFPVVLYYKGDINILDEDAVGIIGSRIALKSSLEKARSIAQEISIYGINVISGLARGIDKFAHLGCLDINMIENRSGKTIAILGSGIDNKSFYPQENYKVFERIVEYEGCVLTEFPINTKPLSYNFPYRNRIISGLSDKIIVIQADRKSGSLITVDYALEQGKDIYVIKPDKNMSYFSGNMELINQGANIYENTEKLILN